MFEKCFEWVLCGRHEFAQRFLFCIFNGPKTTFFLILRGVEKFHSDKDGGRYVAYHYVCGEQVVMCELMHYCGATSKILIVLALLQQNKPCCSRCVVYTMKYLSLIHI